MSVDHDESHYDLNGGRNPLGVAATFLRCLPDHPDEAYEWTFDAYGWDFALVHANLDGLAMSSVVRHAPDDERVAYCLLVEPSDLAADTSLASADMSAVDGFVMTLVQLPDETWRVHSVGRGCAKPQLDAH